MPVKRMLMMLALAGWIGTAQAQTPVPAGADIVTAGAFSTQGLAGWEAKTFKGETRYALVADPASGIQVLQAKVQGTASGRFRKIRIDLTKTPFLNWSWQVGGVFAGIDESSKAGDDYPARIYVVVERGVMGMGSLSLNYVWASQHAAGALWSSPYTGQVKLMAVRSGASGLGTWVSHKRNVRADLRAAFGEDITTIDAVALMSDGDNAGGAVTSLYGDIWFSAR